jgi:hypothetical protein
MRYMRPAIRPAVRTITRAVTVVTTSVLVACGDETTRNLGDAAAARADDADVMVDAPVGTWDGPVMIDATVTDAAPVEAVPLADANTDRLQLLPAWGWTYKNGDAVNVTPAILAAYGDGVVLAGASADPMVVGVPYFDDAGTVSEAFLGRLAHDGHLLWSLPLASVGMPVGLAVDAHGGIVVSASYLPGFPQILTGRVSSDLYLAKFGGDGAPLYATHPNLAGIVGSGDIVGESGLAVDSTDAVYIVASITRANLDEAVLLMKCDSGGNVVWTKIFPGDPGKEIVGVAIAVLANDEVAITGDFDGHVDFGGGAVASDPQGSFRALGYLARFSPSGQYLSSITFGGTPANYGWGLAPSGEGDVILGGHIDGDAQVGGVSLHGDPAGSPFVARRSPFVARLDRNGVARWATLIAGATPDNTGSALAVDHAGYVHLAGYFGGELLIANYDSANATRLRDVRVTTNDAGAGVVGNSLAVDSTQSLWVSGSFGENATLGTIVLKGRVPDYANQQSSIFVARLDPGGP